MRTLLLAWILITLLFSCKEGVERLNNCCDEQQVVVGPIYAPKAYTPNNDALNDLFQVIPAIKYNGVDTTEDLKYAFEFIAVQNGRILVSRDTMFSRPTGKNNFWDLKDRSGKVTTGKILLSYKLMDLKGRIYKNTYKICSIECDQIRFPINEISNCTFEDMIDPSKGFINPTNEVGCD